MIYIGFNFLWCDYIILFAQYQCIEPHHQRPHQHDRRMEWKFIQHITSYMIISLEKRFFYSVLNFHHISSSFLFLSSTKHCWGLINICRISHYLVWKHKKCSGNKDNFYTVTMNTYFSSVINNYSHRICLMRKMKLNWAIRIKLQAALSSSIFLLVFGLSNRFNSLFTEKVKIYKKQ